MSIQRTMAVLALIAGALAAGCGDDDSAGGSSGSGEAPSFTLVLGQLVPDTGPLSSAASSTHKNAELAVREVEKALKKAGADVSIELASADSQTTPEGAVSAARKVLAEDSTCVVGPLTSSETIAVAESVTVPEGIPMVSPSATAAAITKLEDDGLVYRATPSDTLAAAALAKIVSQKLGEADGKALALAARNDDYGTGFLRDFERSWKELGGTTTDRVVYDPGAASLDSEATKIVSGDPDGYVIADFLDGYTKLGPALLRTGDFDLQHAFLGDALAATTPSEENVPAEIFEGSTGVKGSSPTTTDAYKAYIRRYESSPGVKDPGGFGPQVFDATMMCVLAAVAAGSAEPEAIAKELTDASRPGGPVHGYHDLDEAVAALVDGDDINFDGVSGPIDWDENGDVTGATYDVIEFQGGENKVVRSFQVGAGDE